MKEKMERFFILPFSVGCVSESSVAIGVDQPPKSSGRKPDNNIISNKLSPITRKRKEDDDEESSSSTAESMKSISSLKFLAIPKPSISKLLKSFKNFTQLFVYKEEMEDELEMEMEIGNPTDVKHVTHIGLDGSANTNPIQGWDHLFGPHRHHQLISSLSDSPDDDPLKQFELSMAAQAAGQGTTLVPRHHQLNNKVY